MLGRVNVGGGENVTPQLDAQETIIEQIKEILPFKGSVASVEEVLKCGFYTKVAIDEFTASSDTSTPLITHSLGEVPKAYIILPIGNTNKTNHIVSVFGATNGAGDYWSYNYYNASNSLTAGQGSAYAYPTATTIQPKVNSNGFGAGITYKVITMA